MMVVQYAVQLAALVEPPVPFPPVPFPPLAVVVLPPVPPPPALPPPALEEVVPESPQASVPSAVKQPTRPVKMKSFVFMVSSGYAYEARTLTPPSMEGVMSRKAPRPVL